MRAFNDSTARVSTVLEGEREDLAATLKALSLALVDVNSLVKENRGALKDNIDNIGSLAALLAKHKADLEEITVERSDRADQHLVGLQQHVRNPRHQGQHPELFFGGLANPAGLVCNLLGETSRLRVGCAPPSRRCSPTLPDLPLPRARCRVLA